MDVGATGVMRSVMQLPRVLERVFHEMTQAHMAFLRGDDMSGSGVPTARR